MLLLQIGTKTWPWLLLLDAVGNVRDNTSTSIVKPLVLDLHRCHEFGFCSLEQKEFGWTGEKTSLQKNKAYMYVVVSRVGPEWWMEVDVHLLPTNLLQAMDHLLCSRIFHNSFKERANPVVECKIATYPPSFGGIPQYFLCLAFAVQLL